MARLTTIAATCTLALSSLLTGQTTMASDVGLTLDGGLLTVIFGQDCGPFSCTPFHASTVGAGQPRTVGIYGAPQQPFVLAIDLAPGFCVPFPGIANAIILPNPITIAIGGIGPGSTSAVCPQGRAGHVLLFPNGTPPGVDFLLQGIAISRSLQQPAFTIAIQARTG